MKLFYTILMLLFSSILNAQNLRLPKIFGDNMMRQRHQQCAIWGKSSPNAVVCIEIGKILASCKADEKGDWKTFLSPLSAGLNYEMKIISSGQSIRFKNIAVGDVYYAVRQSNMQYSLLNSLNGAEDVTKATNKNIRIFTAGHQIALKPQQDFIDSPNNQPLDNKWHGSPETVKDFSAVAYYFARKIQTTTTRTCQFFQFYDLSINSIYNKWVFMVSG